VSERTHGIAAAGFVTAIGIFVVATLALRLPGIDHGAPRFVFHPDVMKQAMVAREFHRGATRPQMPADDIELRYYPYGASALLGRGLRLVALAAGGQPDLQPNVWQPEERWRWARRLRAFGLVVYLVCGGAVVFVIAHALGPVPGSLLALSLAADPLFVEHSLYGMNDVPLAALLALAWVLQPTQPGDRRATPLAALGAGLALGLACGVKYQGVLGLVFPVLALRVPGSRPSRAIALLLGIVAGLWCTTPLLFEQPRSFGGGLFAFLTWQTGVTGLELSVAEKVSGNSRWLVELFGSQPASWLLLAAPMGLRWRAGGLGPPVVDLVSGLVFVGGLLALLVGSRDLMRGADLLPAIPIATAIALHALGRGETPRDARFRAIALLLAVPVGFQLASGIAVARAFTRPDTRLRALAWLHEHAPAGTRVVAERYTIPDGPTPWRVTRARYLFERPARGPLARGEFDLLISSSLAADRFSDPRSRFADEEAGRFYAQLERDFPLVAELTERPLDFAHPRITIRRGPGTRPATDRSPSDE
jgi:hypothetical protein